MNDGLYDLLKEKDLPVLGCWDGRVEFTRLLTPGEAAVFRKVLKRGKLTLTHRHKQLLTMAAHGCANKEISTRYGISISTVKNHFSEIYRRLEVADRAGAVAVAIRQGIL